MIMYAWAGGIRNLRTTNAKEVFDRWDQVREILFDVRLAETVPGGWLQSRIRVMSGIGDETLVDVGTKEIGYAEATENWKTLLYEVDMTDHLDNIADPEGWIQIAIETNNDASADGFPIFIDHFRVGIPVTTDLQDWSLF